MNKEHLKQPIIGTLLVLMCLFTNLYRPLAQSTNHYFVSFVNKVGTPHQLNKPEAFLSQRAIDRRSKQGIVLDSTDLGVSKTYLDSLIKLNITIHHTSKWLNGAIVSSSNQPLMDTLNRVGFIKSVELNKGVASSLKTKFKPLQEPLKAILYGAATNQIRTVNGIALHDKGFTGNGMHIAVIDAGFYKANQLPTLTHLFANSKILGTKDFVNPNSNVYNEHSHGMNVLSIIGGYIDGTYCGTAPQASFWLLRTEDSQSEYPIEGDNWACAAEFADSAGVDVINTSLGYTTFDNPAMNLTPTDLNGSTRISKASHMATTKGMVVVVSAGNEGINSWRYISTPSDPTTVLSIGAMRADSVLASFSSVGYPPLNVIKPDVTAMGFNTAVQDVDGSIKLGSGTSYSAPVVTGLIACLWQSLPHYKATEITQLVRESSHHFKNPDFYMGYGIPDFNKAYLFATAGEAAAVNAKTVDVWPNPFDNEINVTIKSDIKELYYALKIFNVAGQLVVEKRFAGDFYVVDQLGFLSSGIYFLAIEGADLNEVIKLVKH